MVSLKKKKCFLTLGERRWLSSLHPAFHDSLSTLVHSKQLSWFISLFLPFYPHFYPIPLSWAIILALCHCIHICVKVLNLYKWSWAINLLLLTFLLSTPFFKDLYSWCWLVHSIHGVCPSHFMYAFLGRWTNTETNHPMMNSSIMYHPLEMCNSCCENSIQEGLVGSWGTYTPQLR